MSEEEEQEERRLLPLLRSRDSGAFVRIYRSYRRPLSGFLRRVLHRSELVDEVIDDTMMIVWSRIDRFESRSRLSTWIYGIAYRQALSALRRDAEPPRIDPADPGDDLDGSPEHGLGRKRAHGRLVAAIAKLSPPHRAVVTLTYFHEMSYREVAAIMSCPEDTVKTRMFHARRRLRQLLPGTFEEWL